MRARHLAGPGVLLLCGFAAVPSLATESGTSFYIPGLRGPLAGVTPPPGFYLNNDTYYYGEFGGGWRTEIGGAILANVKQRAYVDFVTPIWVTPLQLLGGNLAFSVTLPVGAPFVSAGTLIEAPRLGRTFRFKQRDQDLSLGDPIVTGFIGWHSGNFHWQAGVSVNVPAGAYREGELSNVALNRWVGDIYGTLTWLSLATRHRRQPDPLAEGVSASTARLVSLTREGAGEDMAN